ncbi:MAG: protein phosphatase CheZ [Thermodesulfobacteriota bacterium]|nr:protein phosphatase CheZ [Thermodesulfobacteriota bacterium]
MDENLPIIELELNAGSFKIKTGEAIYRITVQPDSSLTRVVEKVVKKEAVSEVPASPGEDPFYREISEELYTEIGRLARQLSLSIKDIPGEHFTGVDIEQTGIELEDAKGQLEDIVQMTEKATMDIMDLTESISGDCQDIQTHLEAIKDLNIVSGEPESMDWEDASAEDEGPNSSGAFLELLGVLLDQGTKLKDMVSQLSAPAPDQAGGEPESELETETETSKETAYNFDLDVVFQTLYELCTNEAVKDHIKAMRAEQASAFDVEAVQKDFSDLAPTVDMEDNFFNFQITAILKSLFQACRVEKFKQVLKKMNQTAGKIFLDSILPLEGQVEEREIATEKPADSKPAPVQPGVRPEKIEELLALIEEGVGKIQAERERLEGASKDTFEPDAEYTTIKTKDWETIVREVENSTQIIERMTAQITRIMESLSFQDLSGQRIFKIVGLISAVQVQLLSLLVSFGAKLKEKEKEHDLVSGKDTDEMAQEEVDKMLERISGSASMEGPAAEGRLNQDNVDDLLADLGF